MFDISYYLRNSGEFTKRIKHRHQTFWKDPNAELIRNTKMAEIDPITKWRDVPNWQRKLSNKFNAREFAKKYGCRVPDLYWKGRDVENVDFSKLPPYYVIRPTSGFCSSNVFIMSNGLNLFNNSKPCTPEEIKAVLKHEVHKTPHLEFLFEEFLMNEQGEHAILDDYKIHCSNGEIACIWVINRLGPKEGRGSFYDENWNRIERVHHTYTPAPTQPPPLCLDEMIAYAKTLSKAYEIFVRIDFYATPKGCVFGEFTPTPGMGMNYTRFGRKLMIKYWETYCNGLI